MLVVKFSVCISLFFNSINNITFLQFLLLFKSKLSDFILEHKPALISECGVKH